MLGLSTEEPGRDVLPVATPKPRRRAAPVATAAIEPSPAADRPMGVLRRLMWSTPVLFGLSVVLMVAAGLASNADASGAATAVLATGSMLVFAVCVLMALWRTLRGLATLVQGVRDGTAVDFPATFAVVLGNLVMLGFGALIAYLGTVGFSRGRQLRRRGRVLLPGLRSNPEWTSAGVTPCHETAPAGLADQWRENGKTEHASVAAFARLTLDLMTLGAPPALVAAANQDALDEIRHTELCFSLAYALDGRRVSPGPFPQAQRVGTLPRSRTLALAKLAVDSLVDGALHEGVSARIIAKLSQRCDVPPIRAALKEIAADEGRHAAHGWAVVRWCLETGGPAVGQALLGAIRALPRQMDSQLPEAASEGGWESWGIHGHPLEGQEYQAARAHVIERVQAMVTKAASVAA